MNDYPIEVALIAVTRPIEGGLVPATGQPGGEALIEYAGRLCWASDDKTGTTPDRIQKWLQVGHESMVEHAAATFFIRASRIFMAEWTRHRLASYSIRSQRHIRENERLYIVPPPIDLFDGPPKQVFFECMEQSWLGYEKLLHYGVKPEIARYVLPGACETQIVSTMNYRELRLVAKQRTARRALPEMRCVAGKVLEICKQIAPQVFSDL